jgi:hypothetical protein
MFHPDTAVVTLDYMSLKRDAKLEDLPNKLKMHPGDMIACLELAAHLVC